MLDAPPLPPRRGGSAVLKVIAIGVLGTCLIIPLALIWILVAERSSRRDQVVTETVSSIGRAQTVGGVVLDLPYEALERQTNGTTTTVTRHAFVHPQQLTIEATATPEVRHRSLYSVIVYRTTVRLKGTIAPPDLGRLNAAPVAVHWDRAATTIEISDLRGTLAVSPLLFGDRPITLEPTTDTAVFASGVRGLTPLEPDTTAPIPFVVDLTLAGSDALRFLPTGKATTVRLGAGWPDPGFSGAFLPTARSTTPQGFEAQWQVSYLARAFPQAWLEGTVDRTTLLYQRNQSTFGVSFVQAVDQYQQTERAVKYGLLFVLLTFTVFLLWELLRDLRLHPVQYLLIGAALVVFYLLLLSLAEHMRFALAYAIAATATISLVAGYAASVLAAGIRGALGIGTWLSALYGVLFVLLQLEDVALLVGSVFVFAMLALVMFMSRRIDWSGARVAEPV
ncbi:MAG: cell envelope integrity protein CreD [Vicinamibacteraceae bacterium]